MKIEKIVEKFYEGLAEHKIYARRCLECGAIEYPPRYACNTCGYHETEWVEPVSYTHLTLPTNSLV